MCRSSVHELMSSFRWHDPKADPKYLQLAEEYLFSFVTARWHDPKADLKYLQLAEEYFFICHGTMA